MKLIKKLINLFKRSSPLIKLYPTCYNCKYSWYGGGLEGCILNENITDLSSNSACISHKYQNN